MPRVSLTARSGPDGKARLFLFSAGRSDLLALGHCRRLLKSAGMVDKSFLLSSLFHNMTESDEAEHGFGGKKNRRH